VWAVSEEEPEPLPELLAAAERLGLEAAAVAEPLAAVEEVQEQAPVVQLSPLRQASPPALPTLPPDLHQARRQLC